MKIVAKVKFNDEIAYVLDDMAQLEYDKHKHIIYGTNGVIYDIKAHVPNSTSGFSGHEFTYQFKDGTEKTYKGSLWDSWDASQNLGEVLGKNIDTITVKDVEGLKNCYVFNGMYVDVDALKELDGYDSDKVYDYDEYRNYLKENHNESCI